MKVLVYGDGQAPKGVRDIQTAQVVAEDDLYGLVHDLSGGEFVLVVLASTHEATALDAARIAEPHPKVVLATGGQLKEVIRVGVYRSFVLTG